MSPVGAVAYGPGPVRDRPPGLCTASLARRSFASYPPDRIAVPVPGSLVNSKIRDSPFLATRPLELLPLPYNTPPYPGFEPGCSRLTARGSFILVLGLDPNWEPWLVYQTMAAVIPPQQKVHDVIKHYRPARVRIF